MKKITVAFVAICLVAIIAVFFLVPGTLTVSESVRLPCVPDAAFRILSNQDAWIKFWPDTNRNTIPKGPVKTYSFSNYRYSISDRGMNALGIRITNEELALSSEMNFLSVPTDSMLIRWHVDIHAGNNPFNRIREYQNAVSLKRSMHIILGNMQSYLSVFKNVYGFVLEEKSIEDTFLVSTKAYTAGYPSVDFIYSQVDKLRSYCTIQENCHITGTPMLNIIPVKPQGFQLMVALPVNRFIASGGPISGVKMVPGKFVVVDVKGGVRTIEQTHQQLVHFLRDYHRISMAIPFDYLLTDRLHEPDTLKWLTRIYSPIY